MAVQMDCEGSRQKHAIGKRQKNEGGKPHGADSTV
jgi:hypothetical protein